jgi:hypothetical protein
MGSRLAESRTVNCLTLAQQSEGLEAAVVDAFDLPHFESSMHRPCAIAAHWFGKPKKYRATHCLSE